MVFKKFEAEDKQKRFHRSEVGFRKVSRLEKSKLGQYVTKSIGPKKGGELSK